MAITCDHDAQPGYLMIARMATLAVATTIDAAAHLFLEEP